MNSSGIQPLEYNVLVLPKEVEAKTAGGVLLPDDTKEKEQFGQMEGRLVAVSPLAFNFDEMPPGMRPQPGAHVIFYRYEATEIKGRDGKMYWLMKDKAIAGMMTDA